MFRRVDEPAQCLHGGLRTTSEEWTIDVTNTEPHFLNSHKGQSNLASLVSADGIGPNRVLSNSGIAGRCSRHVERPNHAVPKYLISGIGSQRLAE
jgi:hypothetical protein